MATEPSARPAPAIDRSRQSELYHRALKTLPGGTDSNFRAWGEDTIYVDRGKGGEVWDIDGNRVRRPADGLRPGHPRARRRPRRRLRQRADAPRASASR